MSKKSKSALEDEEITEIIFREIKALKEDIARLRNILELTQVTLHQTYSGLRMLEARFDAAENH